MSRADTVMSDIVVSEADSSQACADFGIEKVTYQNFDRKDKDYIKLEGKNLKMLQRNLKIYQEELT